MARKRMIDPEFWSDEELGQWTFKARLFYIGLWNFADDQGRFKAHPQLLKSQIFPYDTKIDIQKLKKEVTNKIQWYENNGSKYGHVRNFLKHQRIDRPTESKLPNPPQLDESSASPQRSLEANISKVNIKEDNIKKVIFSFKDLWTNYPKKVGSKEAERHFHASVKTQEDFNNINLALNNYLKSERVKKGYVQNGATWFNNWQDWIENPEKGADDGIPEELKQFIKKK